MIRFARLLAGLAASVLLVVPLSGAAAGSPPRPAAAPAAWHRVTLITGDVVRVLTGPTASARSASSAGPDGADPEAAINRGRRPPVRRAARGHAAARREPPRPRPVRRRGLIRDRLRRRAPRDAARDRRLRPGSAAAGEARSATLATPRKTVTLPALGAAAFAADKSHAHGVLALPDDERRRRRRPTALADGATRVDLDGRVHALLDASVPQIHAPEAWAAGLRRHRHDGRGARHRLRPDPPRPRRAASRARRTSPPTRASPTATATAPTSPRRSPAPARPRPASTRASRRART